MAILRLENEIMNYAWGSREDIAALQGRPVPSPRPEAELWLGAHPKAPSRVGGRPLDEIIAADPVSALGAAADACNGRLPFLFKLLAAAEPLSLQTHPNRTQARAGYARENAAGVPLDAPDRNYRDDNHKPEIICALSEFWALNGFRPRDELLSLLKAADLVEIAPEIAEFRTGAGPDALRTFFAALMSLPQERITRLNAGLFAAADGGLADHLEGSWLRRVHDRYPHDAAVIAVLLLNLVRLDPGQAMFSSAGKLHAYLSGFCVELMANSDNVLRCGLTPKHVDLDELLATLTFDATPSTVIEPEAGVYAAPTDEFELTGIRVRPEAPWRSTADHGFEILVAVRGEGMLDGENLRSGEALAVTAHHGPYGLTGDLDLFKAEARPDHTRHRAAVNAEMI